MATPRDELLARVTARGARLRLLRRAAQGAVVASVLAVASAGGVAVYSSLGGDGQDGTSADLAVSTDGPDLRSDRATSTVAPAEAADEATPVTDRSDAGSDTPLAPDPPTDAGSSPDADAATTSGSGEAGGPAVTAPARPGSTTSTSTPSTSTPSSSTPPADGADATPPEDGDEPPAVIPTMGQLRMRTTGVPTGTSLCLGEPDSEAAIPIDEATTVVVSWMDGGITRSVMAEHDGAEWRASLASLTERLDGFEMVQMTVTATGPGGTIDTSHAVEVVDCS